MRAVLLYQDGRRDQQISSTKKSYGFIFLLSIYAYFYGRAGNLTSIHFFLLLFVYGELIEYPALAKAGEFFQNELTVQWGI